MVAVVRLASSYAFALPNAPCGARRLEKGFIKNSR
jgi:hypothetical protein